MERVERSDDGRRDRLLGPLAPTPPAPRDRRTLAEEVVVVLMLSLLASAVYAFLSLLEAPLAGTVVASANQSTQLARQLAGFVFGLAPVYLVAHLVRRSGEGLAGIGLAPDRPRADATRGIALFAVVGLVGFGVYLAAVELGVNRFVVPAPPLGRWWTVPILLLTALEAALVEEVIVLGYLVTRLRQLSWSPIATVAGSSLLRGSYHLYQGWGGFLGNLAMGVLFCVLFLRWRRTWPFVIAHFLLDVVAGLGYIWFRDRLPGF
jgi:membrane protease YdiL (CAAX protease family)